MIARRSRAPLGPASEFRCELCGAAHARIWRRESPWQVVKCEDCGLLATWPSPTDVELMKLHDATEYYRRRDMADRDLDSWRGRARQVLGALPPGVESVLDFGAGTGGLVRALRDLGYQADGVEPTAAGRRLARKLYDVELLTDVAGTGERRYSAIVMLHVLEHLRHPVQELEALSPRLGPGGVVFIEVPHAGSPDRFIPSQRREILDLPAHMHHFTPRTASRLLEQAGYGIGVVKLFNLSLVERAIAKRCSPTAGDPPGTDDPPGDPGTEVPLRGGRARRAWRALLAATRSVLPGPTFQVVAHRRRDDGVAPAAPDAG